MGKSKFRQVQAMRTGSLLEFTEGPVGCVLCPDMGGRIFAEVCGVSVHRIDLECIAKPHRAFNNFGGGNFWPAPEGGKFAFNYRGDEWYVQDSINKQPFQVGAHDTDSAVISKRVLLVNRAGTVVEAKMKRELSVPHSIPPLLERYPIRGFLTYKTTDSFDVLNPVTPDQALIGAWSLEQFETSDFTVSFCHVENPKRAINFDFYEYPNDRITYFAHGFTYRTDGKCKGQIGIKKEATASFVGFYDLSRLLMCMREHRSGDGLYFNIADNDQPNGPYSAADNYSIFNSDSDMQAFELETVSGARIQDGFVQGSNLVSLTTIAAFESSQDLQDFIAQYLGG